MKNLEYLQDQVKYSGFGDELSGILAQKIEEGKPEFKLQHSTQFGNDTVTSTLNFSQSKQSDMYFFNSYKVSLEKEGTQQSLEQTFYINKGNSITLKEAYNLMEGRAVNKDLTNKDGQLYNAWVQIDFKQSDSNGNFKLKQYHENYGFDLEAALGKHPIKELEREDYKSNLLESLKKGNLQSVTFRQGDKEVKQYVEASPQFKMINVYDTSLKRVGQNQSKKEAQSESESQSEKQTARHNRTAEDEGPDMPQKNKRKKKQSLS